LIPKVFNCWLTKRYDSLGHTNIRFLLTLNTHPLNSAFAKVRFFFLHEIHLPRQHASPAYFCNYNFIPESRGLQDFRTFLGPFFVLRFGRFSKFVSGKQQKFYAHRRRGSLRRNRVISDTSIECWDRYISQTPPTRLS